MLSLARTQAVLRAGVAAQVHAGAQLALVHRGELVECGVGLARPDRQIRPESILLWMSSTKPLMSVAIGQLVERGLVDFDDPVAKHLPEFAANGKEGITLRHLLTHTAGIPNAHKQWSRESWDEIVAKICAAALEPGFAIGVDCEYHVASAWYVLGEIVRRRDGRTYGDYVRQAIFAPLGSADFWVGMSAADYDAHKARIAHPYDALQGPPAKPISFWAWSGSQESLAICRPGGSGWGSARALALFYDALLRGGAPLLRSDTLQSLTTCALPGVQDRAFGPLNRALGFVRDSKYYGSISAWYGPRCSPNAYGHAGFACSVAFADPGYDLALALAFNGFARAEEHHQRSQAALAAIYEDLRLSVSAGTR